MKIIFTLYCLIAAQITFCQSVGIGTTTPNSQAALDISATGKGLLIPRMDSATRAGITSPPDGLMVFQTDHRKGFWYAISNTWLYIPDKVNSGDNLGSHTATQSIETSNYDIRLSGIGDNNHGLGWYGASSSPKNWLSQYVDGPVLYGFEGGVLGTKAGSPASILSWKRTGRVGINNTDPQHALDVNGTTRSEQFTYLASQIRYLTLPVDAFNSVDPGAYRAFKINSSAGGNNSTIALWLNGGTTGQEGYVSAPVNLPQGAVISNLAITGINNDGTAINPGVTISAIQTATNNTSAYGFVLNTTANLTTESPGWQTASTALNHTVRNDLYSYKVVVRLNQNNGGTILQRVRISYNVINPD